MPKRSSIDLSQGGAGIVRRATTTPHQSPKNPAAVALGRLGGKKGGPARAAALSKKRRVQIARKALRVRCSCLRWIRSGPILWRGGRRIYARRSRSSAQPLAQGRLFDHLALAAFFAIAFRRVALSFAARAFPPFNPPSRPSATAAGFFPSSVADATIRDAMTLGSVLERLGMEKS